jgi:FkbM family methyltransferase
MKLKNMIKKLFNRMGYEIKPIDKGGGLIRTTVGESYTLVHKLGFSPVTVIDIGIATGTDDLYTAFPDSYFLLVEPLKEFEPTIISILQKYKGSYIMAAAGSSSGQVTFNAHPKHMSGSSLLKESMGSEADGYEITVPMIKIDDVVKEKQLKGPYLIKVDVQGAELDVLNGALQTLLETEVVALEVSLFEFMKGAPQFFDVISYMKNHGFVAFDIVPGWNRPLDNALGQVDIVFVKENGRFRQNHSYSTIEQMKTLFGE